MYVSPNFKTKRQLKQALASGWPVSVYQPNNMFNVEPPRDGTVYLEGPHYPKPHAWYAEGTMKAGKLVSIR